MRDNRLISEALQRREPVILVVEDEPLIRMATAELLRDAGYEVREAANGEEAMRLVEALWPIHLVVSDIRMPGIDGVTLAALVHQQHPLLPVILVSSHLQPGVSEQAAGFLAKPFRDPELLGLVKELLESQWTRTSSQIAS